MTSSNWYEHFQGLGFNLETGPLLFDGIYTGTQTRDAVRSAQHLQPYHGYSIMRYFENLAPGRNGGGWVDPYGSRGYGRYFRDEAVDVGVVVAGGAWLADIASGESVAMTIRPPRGRVPAQPGPAAAGAAATSVRLPAHGWQAFRIVK